MSLLRKIHPHEIYHLGAMSHVKVSFEEPHYTLNTNSLGTLNLLESIVQLDYQPRFYNASTSELYGLVQEIPQTESTPFYPRSPYGVSKLAAYWLVKNYRESYNLHASNGILFNHESPRRGETFVTRKITRGLSRISTGLQQELVMGNLDARRDWGHAKDYVRAMWLMLQQDEPDDYVIATGIDHSVRDFINHTSQYFGFDIEWRGEGLNETGYCRSSGKDIIRVSEKYFRPCEVDCLLGDSTKAHQILGWKPEMSFDDLIQEMIIYGQ